MSSSDGVVNNLESIELEKIIDSKASYFVPLETTRPKSRARARSVSPANRFRPRNMTPPMAHRILPPVANNTAVANHTAVGHTLVDVDNRNNNYKTTDNGSNSSEDHTASNRLTIIQKECLDNTYTRAVSRQRSSHNKASHTNNDIMAREEYLRQKKKEKYTREELDWQRKLIEDKIDDIQHMLNIELNIINKKSDDPQKARRRQKIEKLFKEAKDFSKMDYDMDTWREIEDYWEELRAEQLERLKDNIALTDDIIIDNDFLIVDSNEVSKNNIQISDDEMLSISLDIVAIYLKGQKILYTEAKTFCEQQLNFLMMPAIFISALTTVLSMALDKTSFGSILIASLTAVNSFVLAIISYLKLDAKSEAHKTSAYQFDKLQSKCEFGSGRVIFFSKAKYLKGGDSVINEQYKSVFDLIDEIELKVTEIKDMNKFILPERVRRSLANLYGVNVFSAVKSFLTSEKYLKAELNRCIEIQKKYNDEILKIGMSIEERQASRDLIYTWNVNMRMKRDIERKLIEERENYMKLDRSMLNDISSKHVNQMDCCCCNCCGWLKT
jgi:hypothetical protein